MKTLFISIISSIFASLLVWHTCASGLGTSAWGPVTNDFQMSIKLKNDRDIITNSLTCVLLISYRNVSTNENFWVYERNGIEFDPEYSFTVISPSGKNVSPDMRKVLYGDSGANDVVPPGLGLEIKFDLSKLCTFDENGTYKIMAEKKGIWAVGKKKMFKVVSNPLCVTVVPAQQP